MTNATVNLHDPAARVLLHEDFSVPELNRSIWNVRTTGPVYNDEQQAYVDTGETVYVANAESVPGATQNALVLQTLHRPGHLTPQGDRFDFISGRIDTRGKFDFQYGSASARILLPPGDGVWPAFWILGYDQWPSSGEIDVMEYVGETAWTSAAVHGPGYFGEAGLVNKWYFPEGDGANDWHVYGVDWLPDSLSFRVDGRLIYRVTRHMTDFFGPWVFDNRKYLILNCALGGTYPFKTNGVNAPYYGLPSGTVELIKQKTVRMAVDWIRVVAHHS